MNRDTITVVGLGYVGLHVAVGLSNKFNVVGYDINNKRINELKNNNDTNDEISNIVLKKKKIFFTSNINTLPKSNIYIITVPTPIHQNKKPNLIFLKKASIMVGKLLTKNSIVVYESTVYPGLTEEYCIPILEKYSNLNIIKDFNVAYSPERINPSDKNHNFNNISKIVSATNKKSLNKIKNIYQSVIKKKVYEAKSIKVAEAAKVIENTQRDINIAFMNELSLIFNKMNIDINAVLEAAKTKWNFLNFYPGLVGGHCIGVDPYYLTYASKKIKYNPKVILAGRKINDSLAFFIAKNIEKKMFKNKKLSILIIGASFKENCKDLRNSKVYDIFTYFKKNKYKIKVCDPVVDQLELKNIYRGSTILFKNIKKVDVLVLAVPHIKILPKLEKNLDKILLKKGIFFDLRGVLRAKYRKLDLDKYFYMTL